MRKYDEPVWMGSDSSYKAVVDAYNYYLDNPGMGKAFLEEHAANITAESPFLNDEDEYEPFFDLLQEFDGVGIVNITGSLVAEDSWVNALFGLTSYESIINAVSYLAEHDGISKIVLNVDSGGGTTSGIESAGKAIAKAGESKPVLAHVNGSSFSAAYWLSSAAQSINSTMMSESGSIGVLLTHKAMYKYLEDQGYDVTIITAGKYKGIGHPAKPLSDSDKEYLQSKAETLYEFFLNTVSENRPQLTIANKDAWAEGRTFFAEEALSVGLIDSIKDTDEFFNSIIDKPADPANNSNVTHYQETTMPKAVLVKDSATQAALASGASLEDLEHEVVEDEAGTAATAEGEDGATEGDADNGATASAEGDDGSEEETAASSEATTSALDSTLNKLSELTQANAVLSAEKQALETELSGVKASMESLKTIAIEATHKMQIALRSEPLDLDDLPVATIVAQHNKVKAAFEKQFKVGQSSVSTAKDEDDSPDAFKLGIVPKAS